MSSLKGWPYTHLAAHSVQCTTKKCEPLFDLTTTEFHHQDRTTREIVEAWQMSKLKGTCVSKPSVALSDKEIKLLDDRDNAKVKVWLLFLFLRLCVWRDMYTFDHAWVLSKRVYMCWVMNKISVVSLRWSSRLRSVLAFFVHSSYSYLAVTPTSPPFSVIVSYNQVSLVMKFYYSTTL